jgi:hypothetical protein
VKQLVPETGSGTVAAVEVRVESGYVTFDGVDETWSS